MLPVQKLGTHSLTQNSLFSVGSKVIYDFSFTSSLYIDVSLVPKFLPPFSFPNPTYSKSKGPGSSTVWPPVDDQIWQVCKNQILQFLVPDSPILAVLGLSQGRS
jgi:hypothetical protein